MKNISSIVIENKMVSPDTYLLALKCAIGPWMPGQFVMLQVNDSCDPFLRRPLGILGGDSRRLELLYRIKGRGTRMLSQKKPGSQLEVLGPLGKGFSIPDPDRHNIYIAGGTGIPPITALAERFPAGCLIAGYRSQDEASLVERIREIVGIKCFIVTEDGSLGEKGLVTDMLNRLPLVEKIYACGPMAMLRVVADYAVNQGIDCEVSLEERMGCGFGVCSGCAVMTESGVKRVCKDGPVFNAGEIVWDKPWI